MPIIVGPEEQWKYYQREWLKKQDEEERQKFKRQWEQNAKEIEEKKKLKEEGYKKWIESAPTPELKQKRSEFYKEQKTPPSAESVLSKYGINKTELETRLSKGEKWEYIKDDIFQKKSKSLIEQYPEYSEKIDLLVKKGISPYKIERSLTKIKEEESKGFFEKIGDRWNQYEGQKEYYKTWLEKKKNDPDEHIWPEGIDPQEPLSSRLDKLKRFVGERIKRENPELYGTLQEFMFEGISPVIIEKGLKWAKEEKTDLRREDKEILKKNIKDAQEWYKTKNVQEWSHLPLKMDANIIRKVAGLKALTIKETGGLSLEEYQKEIEKSKKLGFIDKTQIAEGQKFVYPEAFGFPSKQIKTQIPMEQYGLEASKSILLGELVYRGIAKIAGKDIDDYLFTPEELERVKELAPGHQFPQDVVGLMQILGQFGGAAKITEAGFKKFAPGFLEKLAAKKAAPRIASHFAKSILDFNLQNITSYHPEDLAEDKTFMDSVKVRWKEVPKTSFDASVFGITGSLFPGVNLKQIVAGFGGPFVAGYTTSFVETGDNREAIKSGLLLTALHGVMFGKSLGKNYFKNYATERGINPETAEKIEVEAKKVSSDLERKVETKGKVEIKPESKIEISPEEEKEFVQKTGEIIEKKKKASKKPEITVTEKVKPEEEKISLPPPLLKPEEFTIPPVPKEKPIVPKQLPQELSKAKPRYGYRDKQFELDFEDDLDKSAYIIAQEKLSKRDADYLKFVMDNTGLTEEQARQAGRDIKARIKEIVKDSDEPVLKIGKSGIFEKIAKPIKKPPPKAKEPPAPPFEETIEKIETEISTKKEKPPSPLIKPEEQKETEPEEKIIQEKEEEKPEIKTEEAKEPEIKPQPETTKEDPVNQIANFVIGNLIDGKSFTKDELWQKANMAYEGTKAEGKYTSKDVFDAMEIGINLYLKIKTKIIVEKNDGIDTVEEAKAFVDKLREEILERIPSQAGLRTEEQDEFQQFSTPPDLAFVINWVANIKNGDIVLEPSAGTGGLASIAKGIAGRVKVIVNELSPRRAALLRRLKFDEIYTENAEQLHNILSKDVKPTVVIMNPPFSATAGRIEGQRSASNVILHLEQALKRLEPNGRLVALIGLNRFGDSKTMKDWFTKIQQEYNIRAIVEISGKTYIKYGTSFDNRILVIDKTGKTEKKVIIGRVEDVKDAIPLLKEIRDDRPGREIEPIITKQGGTEETPESKDKPRPDDSARVPTDELATGKPGYSREQLRKQPGERDVGKPDVPTERSKGGAELPAEGSEKISGERRSDVGGERLEGEITERSSVDTTRPIGLGDEGRRGDRLPESEGIKFEEKEKKTTKPISDKIFDEYIPSVKGEKLKPHPGKLVESSALAATKPPKITYKPKLDAKILEKGDISDIQFEAIALAGQAHEKRLPDGKRKQFYIGDGTGVGKGREISGIIMDNMNQGRKKAIWISEKPSLVKDALRDWIGIGGDKKKIMRHNQLKGSIAAKEGILFTTYKLLSTGSELDITGSLKTKEGKVSRLKQLTNWLGEDFDGVIIFDEAHNMMNSLTIKEQGYNKKPALQALTGMELKNKYPNARIVDVSATAAVDVSNLVYADRLGLWGEGTPFPQKQNFIERIKQGGLAAVELVIRDLKVMGSYISRSLSYEGVEYRRLTHKLTDEQKIIYNELAKTWQLVLNDVNASMKITGQTRGGRAKGNALAQFWGSHQRFFNQVITSIQMPSVIEDIKKQLKKGNAIILQLVNTNESLMNRQLAKVREEGDLFEDLDLTPRETLMEYVQNSFPTQQFEETLDANGNLILRPVIDSQGNPVQNADAVALRDALLDKLGSIKVPDGPLEYILNEFGPDMVAEITGRTKRVYRVKDSEGNFKSVPVIEKRSIKKRELELEEFMNDKRIILIFSDAGSTGMSFHADLTAKNQRKRIHYVIQPGWRAIKVIQGLGRSHRTGEASQPEYVLAETDIEGHKRFISSIARSLDQVGAITKGLRQAGSQGFFSEKDNLESQYAEDAVRQFFISLSRGEEWETYKLDFATTTRAMGLEGLIDKNGNLVKNLPDVHKFLNRLLSLEIDMQNSVFASFFEKLSKNIDVAKSAGIFDTGMQNYKADNVELKESQVVFTHPETNAETKYIKFETKHKNFFVSLEKAIQPTNIKGSKFKGIYRSKAYDNIYAVKSFGTRTDEKGRIIDEILLQGIEEKNQKILDADRIDNERNWERIPDNEAKKIWEERIEKAPKFKTEEVHLISGLMLPIWDRLPTKNNKIIRIQTDKGEQFIGKIIEQEDLKDTLRNLGASVTEKKYTTLEAIDAAMQKGAHIELANGWKIMKRTIQGEGRLEISDSRATPLWQAEDELKKYGVFIERIGYETRYFIPVGKEGISTLEQIVKYKPIVDVTYPTTRSINLYSGIPIIELKKSIKFLKELKPEERIKQGYSHILKIGEHAWIKGHQQYDKFKSFVKTTLGDMYDSIKTAMPKIYAEVWKKAKAGQLKLQEIRKNITFGEDKVKEDFRKNSVTVDFMGAKTAEKILREFAGALKNTFKKERIFELGRIGKRYFKFGTEVGNVPEAFFWAKFEHDAKLQGLTRRITYQSQFLDKELRTHRKSGQEERIAKEANEFLVGINDGALLPARVKSLIAKMRSDLDGWSQRLIDLNIPSEGIQLAIEKNKGKWVVRAYWQYEAKGKWKPKKAIVEEAKELLVTEISDRYARSMEVLEKKWGKVPKKWKGTIADYMNEKDVQKKEKKLRTILKRHWGKARKLSQWKDAFDSAFHTQLEMDATQTLPADIVKMTPQLTPEKIKELAEITIKYILNAEKYQRAGRSTAKYGITQKSFIKRKNFHPIIRALKGEIDIPSLNFQMSALRINRIIENYKFLTLLREYNDRLPYDSPLRFAVRTDKPQGDMNKRISVEDNPQWKPLDGYHVKQEIYDELKPLFEIEPDISVYAKWMESPGAALKAAGKAGTEVFKKGVFFGRASKTVWNPPTMLPGGRNFRGNIPMAIAAGDLAYKGFGKNVKEAFNIVYVEKIKEWKNKKPGIYTEMIEKGVIGDELVKELDLPTELNEKIRAIQEPSISKIMETIVEYGWRKPTRILSIVNAANDQVFKINAYLHQKQLGKSDKEAIRHIIEHYPNYSVNPKIVRDVWRYFPLGEDFVSFKASTVTIFVHNIKDSAEGLKKGDPRPFIRTMVAYLPMVATTGILWRHIGNTLNGDDDALDISAKQERAYRNLMSWNEKYNNLIMWKKRKIEDGKIKHEIKYVDFGWEYPWKDISDMLTSLAINYDRPVKGVEDAVKKLFDNWIGEGMMFETIDELWHNRDNQTGEKIYNEKMKFWSKLKDKMDHIYKQLGPPLLGGYNWQTIERAWRGLPNTYGIKYGKGEAISATVYPGIRIKTLSLEGSFYSRMKMVRGIIMDQKRQLNENIEEQKKGYIDIEDLEAVNRKINIIIAEQEKEVGKIVEAGKTAGIEKEEMELLLQDVGWKPIDANSIVETGKIPEWKETEKREKRSEFWSEIERKEEERIEKEKMKFKIIPRTAK